jgi:hypothetical protein
MSDFLHVRVGEEVWLSACAACRQVLGFAPDLEDLAAVESGHRCPREQDPKSGKEAA